MCRYYLYCLWSLYYRYHEQQSNQNKCDLKSHPNYPHIVGSVTVAIFLYWVLLPGIIYWEPNILGVECLFNKVPDNAILFFYLKKYQLSEKRSQGCAYVPFICYNQVCAWLVKWDLQLNIVT